MSLIKNSYLAPIIVKVFYSYTYNISSIENGSDDNYKSITFKPGNNWVEIYKVPKDVDYEEPVKKSDAGKLFDQKLTLFFPGDDDSNVTDFNELENRPLIIRFIYSNGKSRFFGALDNPAKASISFSTNKGGATIIFECMSKFRAFWI